MSEALSEKVVAIAGKIARDLEGEGD
jgi:hypothetical protein